MWKALTFSASVFAGLSLSSALQYVVAGAGCGSMHGSWLGHAGALLFFSSARLLKSVV